MRLYRVVRPALFALPAEDSHDFVIDLLQFLHSWNLVRPFCGRTVRDPVELMGLKFLNRVGLAAGLDKNARILGAFGAMGFGFVEAGTVTPRPQPGNPKPRMFRLPRAKALINRMGFNNEGSDDMLTRLLAREFSGPVGVNIGKNADTPIELAAKDYLEGLASFWPIADYITINISSPNTQNLRQLQSGDSLDDLLVQIVRERYALYRAYGRMVPVLLKIAPDLDDAQIARVASRLIRYDIDGVIATNTTVSREAVQGLKHAGEAGGLSGAPVREASNRVIRALRQALPPRYPIIGVGGIMNAADALAKIEAGADRVQIYTGLIYQGPGLIKECARALGRLPTPAPHQARIPQISDGHRFPA
ncbi:MAG: quinone-dependent dihydroorotate dehydrogenase [Burkholderiales bacterium]